MVTPTKKQEADYKEAMEFAKEIGLSDLLGKSFEQYTEEVERFQKFHADVRSGFIEVVIEGARQEIPTLLIAAVIMDQANYIYDTTLKVAEGGAKKKELKETLNNMIATMEHSRKGNKDIAEEFVKMMAENQAK